MNVGVLIKDHRLNFFDGVMESNKLSNSKDFTVHLSPVSINDIDDDFPYDANMYIFVFSDNESKNSWYIQYLQGLRDIDNTTPIALLFLGDNSYNNYFRSDYSYIVDHSSDQQAISTAILFLINKVIKKEADKNRINEEAAAKIELNLSSYIGKTTERLKKNEKSNFWVSIACYIASGLLLMIATVYALCNSPSTYSDSVILIQSVLKSILILALFAALSRFMFILGKAFMVERIRSNDRLHAIEFGEFYLKAYGHVAERQEIREVFGNWNIDKGSSFINQNPSDYDPQIVDKILALINSAKKD